MTLVCELELGVFTDDGRIDYQYILLLRTDLVVIRRKLPHLRALGKIVEYYLKNCLQLQLFHQLFKFSKAREVSLAFVKGNPKVVLKKLVRSKDSGDSSGIKVSIIITCLEPNAWKY